MAADVRDVLVGQAGSDFGLYPQQRGGSVVNRRRLARILIGKNIFVSKAKWLAENPRLLRILKPIFLPANILAMTHAFGMPHDFRNDGNFNGNLMGNGFRGIRGAVYPEQYPNENVMLSYGMALALDTNRYFNVQHVALETNPPSVNIETSGPTDPVDGLLPIRFTASDDTELAAALLMRGGDLIAETALSGTSATHTFMTPYYEPGQEETFEVMVYDVYGNRQSWQTSIQPVPGQNRAPWPFVSVVSTLARVGQPVVLSASRSSDPDHPTASLLVEWDLDGDGIFDTAPTTDKQRTVTFDQPGTRLIQVRVTDPAGASSVSAPIPLRVIAAGENYAPTDIGLSGIRPPVPWEPGTVVGTFSTVDPNPEDRFVYEFVLWRG
jgi:hypothetical protein